MLYTYTEFHITAYIKSKFWLWNCEPSFNLPKHSSSTETNGYTFFSITQGHNKPITAMALLEGTIYSAAGATDSHISILLSGFPTAY